MYCATTECRAGTVIQAVMSRPEMRRVLDWGRDCSSDGVGVIGSNGE